MSDYLQRSLDRIRSLVGTDADGLPDTADTSTETAVQAQFDADTFFDGTRFFQYHGEASDVSSSNRYWAEYTGAAPASIQLQELSSGRIRGWIHLHLQGSGKFYEDELYAAAREHESDAVSLHRPDSTAPSTLAEFSIDPEPAAAAEVHNCAALMVHNAYDAILDKVTSDLNEAEWYDGILEKEMYVEDEDAAGGLAWNLTENDATFQGAAHTYKQELPNLVHKAVHNGFGVSEALYENREQLEE